VLVTACPPNGLAVTASPSAFRRCATSFSSVFLSGSGATALYCDAVCERRVSPSCGCHCRSDSSSPIAAGNVHGSLSLPLCVSGRVAMVSAEAALVMTKATEHFIGWVTSKAMANKDLRDRKKVSLNYHDLPPLVVQNPDQLQFATDL